MHHFIRPPETYNRNIQLVGTYIKDNALYLSLQTGRPLEECEAFVKQAIQAGSVTALKIPQTMVLVKNQHGDRIQQELPFDQFLQQVQESREILSPTMAAYVHPDTKKSLLADYVEGNLAKRKKAKGEMFAAKMAGNKVLEAIKNSEQNSQKIKNNALSGAHSSAFTILWVKSAHSTLTSTCRTATSYGNANNEKFLYGNRHYFTPNIVKANIISIINHTDYEKLDDVMRKYRLKYPSFEDVMACIHRSTQMYWRSANQMAIIESLVGALKPNQRAAFLFTSDFYHLAQVNPEFVREMLTALSTKVHYDLSAEEVEDWLKKTDGNLLAHIGMLCAAETRGQKLEEAIKNPEIRKLVASNIKQIILMLDHYQDFIQTMWVTDNLPSSVYHLPAIVRRGVITSDTDSTIFTVQYWTEWYVGKLDFSERSVSVASSMVYLAGQLIRHILSRFSANMGVARQDLRRLSMKNEYYFPVFSLTSRAKHYFAYIAAQEGNVYEKYDTEIKGVALRNSNVPPEITKKAHALMRELMDTIIRGDKIQLYQVLRYVAKIEKGIRDDLESGSYALLSKMQIKSAVSYTNPSSSNYMYYGLWQEVFGPKYGMAPEPPYVAIKVSIDADNPTKIRNWLASMEDRAVAERLQNWLTSNAKKGVTQLLLPEPVLSMTGIPKEVIVAVDIRGLIAQTMEVFYLILESLGYFCKNNNITKLVSDQDWLTSDAWDRGELKIG